MVFTRIILIIVISYLLSACSIFSPVKTECLNEYMVDTVPATFKAQRATAKTLAVSMPTTNRVYQTKGMVYSTHQHKIDYFAKNKWAETPAQMLQPLIIQSLQNTRHFKAVVPSSGMGRLDLILNTQLLQFQQDFFEHGSVFKVMMRAQLVSVSTGKVLVSKEFIVVEPAPTRNPYGGVVAANQAVAKMLSQLSQWCARY